MNPAENPDKLPPRRRRRKTKRRIRPQASRVANTRQLAAQSMRAISTRAGEKPVGWLVFVLLLTTSLGMHAIFGFGFIPGLFNGLTWINFVIHELGHLAFQLTSEWLYFAGGTFFQLALPVGAIFMFVRQRDDAAACFAACWLAISLVHTADYMADARVTRLDMTMSAQFWSLTSGQPVRPDEVNHDWKYLLSSVGLLQWDRYIAGVVYFFAGIIAAGAIATNVWMVMQKLRPSARGASLLE